MNATEAPLNIASLLDKARTVDAGHREMSRAIINECQVAPTPLIEDSLAAVLAESPTNIGQSLAAYVHLIADTNQSVYIIIKVLEAFACR